MDNEQISPILLIIIFILHCSLSNLPDFVVPCLTDHLDFLHALQLVAQALQMVLSTSFFSLQFGY